MVIVKHNESGCWGINTDIFLDQFLQIRFSRVTQVQISNVTIHPLANDIWHVALGHIVYAARCSHTNIISKTAIHVVPKSTTRYHYTVVVIAVTSTEVHLLVNFCSVSYYVFFCFLRRTTHTNTHHRLNGNMMTIHNCELISCTHEWMCVVVEGRCWNCAKGIDRASRESRIVSTYRLLCVVNTDDGSIFCTQTQFKLIETRLLFTRSSGVEPTKSSANGGPLTNLAPHTHPQCRIIVQTIK